MQAGLSRWPGPWSARASREFPWTPAEPGTAEHFANADLVRALATRALDAAKSAGATYADVRVTRTLSDSYANSLPQGEWEMLGVGVRALVNGYWGFAASPYWDLDEAARLAQDAVSQAKTHAFGTSRTVSWDPIPVATGSWSTPIKYDPFTIPIEEKMAFGSAWQSLATQFDRRVSAGIGMTFERQERTVATTDGAYVSQTLYSTGGRFTMALRPNRGDLSRNATVDAHKLLNTGAGWELFLEANLPEQFPAMVAEAEERIRGYPTKPGDIGRYDLVLDAGTMAALVDTTFGVATQLDRALGYEANASGTSYLGPHPEMYLGSAVASPVVNVTADRSMRRGLATVQWDDEGVTPVAFPLVKNGTLVDYQTTREQAAWLASWYHKNGTPVQSHGCAGADSALSVTMQHRPNIVLEPSRDTTRFEDLVAGTKRGLAIIGGSVETNLTGSEGGIFHMRRCREIIDGKLGQDVSGLVPIFNSRDLWKHVVALGGAASAEQYPSSERKGEPEQRTAHSVRAVPAKVTNVACINPLRGAAI